MRLTLDDIRKTRSLAQFRDFYAHVSSAARASEESRALFRLDSGPYKRWRDEVMPLMQFCDALLIPDTAKIQVCADDGPFDAQISGWPADADVTKLEVTRAVDGQNERLRMELLTQQGWAPGAGPIRIDGSAPMRGPAPGSASEPDRPPANSPAREALCA